MDSIGSRLREERDRLGMTQTEIGEIAGVTKNTQRLYETDQRSPKADYLAALDAARVDVNYVLTGRRSGTSAPAVVDGELMVRIVEQLERIAEDAGKRWPAGQLIATAVEVYNFLLEEDTVDDDKLDRVLRLVVNR